MYFKTSFILPKGSPAHVWQHVTVHEEQCNVASELGTIRIKCLFLSPILAYDLFRKVAIISISLIGLHFRHSTFPFVYDANRL